MFSQEEVLLRQLFMILQKKKNLSDIETVLAPKCSVYLDNSKWVITPQTWQYWVYFLRHKGRLTHANAVLEEIQKNEDHSQNSFIIALITFGEGWHNNHHRFPSSERQGFYWWEIDITHYILVENLHLYSIYH